MAEDDFIFRRAGWQIDLGGGNQVDAEFEAPGQLWVALGSEVAEVSAWMKGVRGFDIRVGIERQPDGLIIRLDRGDNQPGWWSGDQIPELVLRIDHGASTVRVTARDALKRQEVVLAQTEI